MGKQEIEEIDPNKFFDVRWIPLEKHYFSWPGFACFVEHLLVDDVHKWRGSDVDVVDLPPSLWKKKDVML